MSRVGWIVLLLIGLSGCSTAITPNSMAAWEPADPMVQTIFDLPLESGQLVLVGTDTARDLTVSLLSNEPTPYTHVGILVIENGQPFVYEATGTIWPSIGASPPTDSFTGILNKDPLGAFIKPYVFAEIWDLPGLDKAKITEFAVRKYAEKVPFDPYFDYKDHQQLYCSEYVALALEAGGASTFEPTTNRFNPSIAVVLEWMGIAESIVQIDPLVASGERLLVFSRSHSLTEIRINKAVRAELHRRYTCDQALGNIFRWQGSTLKYTPVVKQFVDHSYALYQGRDAVPGQEEVDRAVLSFANQTFGAFDPASLDAACR